MKEKLHCVALLLVLIASGCISNSSPVQLDVSDRHLTKLTDKRSSQLTKLTKQPMQMLAAATKLCTPPAQIENHMPRFKKSDKLKVLSDPQTYLQPEPNIGASGHLLANKIRYAQVYISQDAADLAQGSQKNRVYPEGTLVLKEKSSHADGSGTELFTGMLKRGPGYNPEGGDWEFLVLSGDAKTVTARGKIASCLDCHSRHQKTDYLTESWKTAQ